MRCAVMTVTTVVTVAAGVFAPGHLGELTRVVPFELVDCGWRRRRGPWSGGCGLLPSRGGVYFLLAMCLFPRACLPGGVGQADRRAGAALRAAGPVGEGAAGPAPPGRGRAG